MSTPRKLKILITGGARGIGRGLFRHFLSQGHNVCILDSNASELSHTLHEAQAWTGSSGGVIEGRLCDLTNRVEIKSALGFSENRDPSVRLDVLINNAMAVPHVWGTGEKGMEGDEETVMREWDEKVAVGLTAPFILSRLCVPLLKGNGKDVPPGCIINISSTRAYQAEMDHEAYSAVKAGILGLTQSMAISLGHRHKIRVNAIVPGWIDVEDENKSADEQKKRWGENQSREDKEWHPAGRVGRVDDIAKAVQYLIDSDFVTGQEIVVDGGVTRKMVYPE